MSGLLKQEADNARKQAEELEPGTLARQGMELRAAWFTFLDTTGIERFYDWLNTRLVRKP